jgi:hypothetical protein
MSKLFLVNALYIGFLLSACREVEPAGAVSASRVMGSWQGVQRLVGEDADAVREVRLELKDDGSFLLEQVDDDQTGLGTYEDYDRFQSLTLRFEESTMTDFALAGSIHDFEYEIIEDEFMLNGQKARFVLKRPEKNESQQLNGIWQCREQASASLWQLSIVAEQFYLYSENKDRASVFIKGKIAWDEFTVDDDQPVAGRWEVQDAQPVRVFEQLQVQVVREAGELQGLTLEPGDPESSGVDRQAARFECTRG